MASAKQQENILLTERFPWPAIVHEPVFKSSSPRSSQPPPDNDDMKNAMNEVLCDSTVSLETGPLSGDPILLGFEDRHSTGEETPKKEKGCYGSFIEARLAIEEAVLMHSAPKQSRYFAFSPDMLQF
ncbi:hypothetical protein HBH98_244060 [Parastagonospora nodorum]|nr:hypothetical protein HBH98_244060 [Parastagonospora nodorum]